MKYVFVFIVILSHHQSAYMQNIATLETSSFLVRSIPEKSEIERDFIVRDSAEMKSIMQQVKTNRSKIRVEPHELSLLNSIVISPSKNYCLLYKEDERTTRVFYIAEKQESGYSLVKKIDDSLYPDVRFSRDGNAMVVFTQFNTNFFIYTHKDGMAQQFESFIDFGIPASTPLAGMGISDNGKILAIAASGFYVVNVANKQILYKLPIATTIGIMSFSGDHKFIFLWVGTRIEESNADYIIVNIANQKVVEIINLPPRQYYAGVGYSNNMEYYRTAYSSLISHDLDKDTSFEYKMK